MLVALIRGLGRLLLGLLLAFTVVWFGPSRLISCAGRSDLEQRLYRHYGDLDCAPGTHACCLGPAFGSLYLATAVALLALVWAWVTIKRRERPSGSRLMR